MYLAINGKTGNKSRMPTENWRRRNISPFLSKTLSFFCRLLYQSCVRNCIYVHVYCVLCIVNSVCVDTPTHPLPSALEKAIVRAHNIYHQNSMQLIIMCYVFWAVRDPLCSDHPPLVTHSVHQEVIQGTPWAHHGHTWCHREESSSPTWRRCKVKVRTDASGKRDWFSISKFSLGEEKHISWCGYCLKLWWLNCKRYFVILCRQVFIMST